MPIIVEATYEDGVLKPARPLPLSEHEQVQVEVTIRRRPSTEEAVEAVRRGFGLLRWRGDVATLERLALDAEFDPQESP
ncbi:MAG TPA: antitoxin family protein [Planctomycetaceae bacterium]|nr:antitoxin family protein [Planctomycetaceae bacterium]